MAVKVIVELKAKPGRRRRDALAHRTARQPRWHRAATYGSTYVRVSLDDPDLLIDIADSGVA